MSTKLPKEVARVVNPSKLDDRYLKTQVHTPADKKKREKGGLYFLIEILNPWHPSAQIAQMIMETVKQEYYRIDEPPNKCFERALKSINAQLGSLAKEGETSWVGNLNAIIAAVVDDKIYLTSSGSAQAYMFRDEKISQISQEGKEENSPYPFLEITNGKLQLGDRFVFANSDFFDYVSLDTLRDSTKEDGPKKTAQFVKDTLAREEEQSISSIMIKVAQPNKEAASLPEVAHLKAKTEGADRVETIAKGKKLYHQYQPQAKKMIVKLGRATTKMIKRANQFFSNFVLSTGSEEEAVRTGGEEKKEEEDWDRYTGQSIKKEESVGGSKSKFYQIVSSIGKFVGGLDKKIIIALIIVLILAIGGGFYLRSEARTDSSLSGRLDNIKNMVESAQTKVALHQEGEAKDILIEAQTQLNQLKDNPQVITEVEKLLSEVNKNINQIDNIKVVNSPFKVLTDLNSGQYRSDNIELTDNNRLLTVDNQFGQIYQLNLNSKKIKQLEALPQKAGEVNLGLKPAGYDDLMILSDQTYIYRYDIEKDKLSLVELSLPSSNISGWDSYYGNLYLIDAGEGSVWRYRRGSFGFSNGQPIVSDSQLKKTISLTIDSDIYFLTSEGEVKKYQDDQIQNLSLKNIPQPDSDISQAVKIYTQDSSNKIYLAANGKKRVLVFKKSNGKYLKQYQFPEKIVDFELGKKNIYVLSEGKKVYRVGD